jgi:hypothetical protein
MRKSETRELQDVRRVVLAGWGDLAVEQDPEAPERVTIEADEALLPRLTSQVRGGRLRLGLDLAWWEWLTWWVEWLFMPDKSVHYQLSVRQLEGLSITGAGRVVAGRIEAERCTLRISGSGRVRVGEVQVSSLVTAISGSGDVELADGTADRHQVRISGSGSLRAGGVETETTTVAISGSGSAVVDAQQELEVRITGSGSVTYGGQPQLTQQITGSGRVRQLG